MTNVIPLPSMSLEAMPDAAIDAMRSAEAEAITVLTEQIDEHARTYHDLDAEMHRRMGRIRRFESLADFEQYLDSKAPAEGHYAISEPILLWTTAGVIEARCYRPPANEGADLHHDYRDYDTEHPIDVLPEDWWRYEIIKDLGDFVEPF